MKLGRGSETLVRGAIKPYNLAIRGPLQIFHLRQSTGLTDFLPASPSINVTATTPQAMAITVDRITHPKLVFTARAGPSPALM